MCEFKVYLIRDGSEEREEIVKEILVAKMKEGKVVLLNIFGEPKYVESAVIHEVNTISQELILKTVPSS